MKGFVNFAKWQARIGLFLFFLIFVKEAYDVAAESVLACIVCLLGAVYTVVVTLFTFAKREVWQKFASVTFRPMRIMLGVVGAVLVLGAAFWSPCGLYERFVMVIIGVAAIVGAFCIKEENIIF